MVKYAMFVLRLEDERAEVERQKEYIAKMKAEFQSVRSCDHSHDIFYVATF